MEAVLEACVGIDVENLQFPERILLKNLKGITKLGRCRKTCDYVFCSEPKVLSRLHCSIIEKNDDWFIQDEGSLNGTFINGVKIPEMEYTKLNENDKISFGPYWSTGGKLQYKFSLCPPVDEDTDVEEFEEEQQQQQQQQQLQEQKQQEIKVLMEEGEEEEEPHGLASLSIGKTMSNSSTESIEKQTEEKKECKTNNDVRKNKCLKRGRSKSSSCQIIDHLMDESCPFSSLVRIVKTHAKKLCLTGCSSRKAELVMAAASAACDAITTNKPKVEQYGDHPCVPLLDNQQNSCVLLEKPGVSSSSSSSSSCCSLLPPPAPSKVHSETPNERILSRNISELKSELSCPICQDPFLLTNTLECGHSFCELCINNWLCKCLSCPICRQRVTKPPVKSRTLDKAVEVTLKSNNQAAWELLKERKKDYEESCKKDFETKARLEETLDKALKKGLKCVHIGRPWSEREQCRFLKGLKHYRGAPREAYCASVCLTPCFVQRASLHDLIIAASNVKLKAHDKTDSWDQMDAVQLRNRLSMFLRYG